ncbi:Hypothetical Protein RradSPS_1340 [Rubrobacter radiotolerans]|uniref:Uncharacterized protein n=1 Tax=Rubrobacter radiotolerans TaxID=42256 RepID=A0A023X2S6_RUBRA|nr:hypothetical protein [Rubrobacter radiotolerans]AHY46623.1 Hypothetical Protein RradSPS_1340 [Rubrobacter radiotolerans]MDX5894030.1 hypothetical protein [Rubrobacter radiotolerans]SMC05019.1 conserved hypothetical protein [Rubrobacter radiotolerans DSM 5868]
MGARREDGGGGNDPRFYTPDDPVAVKQENELLAYEVRFLRARLKKLGDFSVPSARGDEARMREAENDLVLVVRRISRTPAAPILRRIRQYRTLESRYLDPNRDLNLSPQARRAQLEQAARDMRRLMALMSKSPVAPILRRNRNFRTLEKRYL